MNELKVFDHQQFGELEILTVSGKEYFPANDTAKKLGYANPSDAVNRHCRKEGVVFHEVLTIGGTQQKKFISEGNLYRLITNSKLPEAEKFEGWVFDDLLPTVRRNGIHAVSQSPKMENFELQLIGARYSMEILRVDESSKVRMLESVHKQHGVPTNHLPAYVSEEIKRSLTDLLKEHDAGFGAAKANNILIKLGLLEIKERPSSNGKTKEFKSLTELGLQYGNNEISPRNPRETQPLYYPSKFASLLELIKSEV